MPDLGAFAAIGAHIDILAALEDLTPELDVSFILPNLFEWAAFQVAERMLCVLVKAAWYDKPVPSDNGGVPQAPAMVVEAVFRRPIAVGQPAVAAIFGFGGNQAIGIVAVIVDLCCLEADLVYADLGGEAADIVELVLIRPDDEELEEDERRFAF